MNMVKKNLSVGVLAGFGAALALGALPAGADGQAPNTRMGWQPFLGCWQADGADEELGILCFAAVGDQVQMLTISDGMITHREPFPADGQPRRIEQDGCIGTESARFSGDQRRIYTTSQVACQDQPPRTGSGIIFMPSAGEWVDVRSSQTAGEDATAWVQWYVRTDESQLNELGIQSGRATGPLAVRGVASFTMAPITIDDVVDASENVDDKAVEAWIAEVGQEFAGLDAEDLLTLDGAGVSGDVIDVVVAVSFPARFAVSDDAVRGQDGYVGLRPLWADPFYYGYGRYGYGYGGWYSPYGYSYGRYYSPYRTVFVDVTRVPRNIGGRAIAGRGYSQGSSGSSSVSPGRGYSGSASMGSSSRIGSSSVGTRSSGGSSRSSSTGRTAKRRGGSSN
ncbi:MAG: hypothetical protein OXI71_06310 [Gemmatimonadota bacterium]|nr:hypothetical protein [Gemmatimonadota bacterium]